MMIDLESVYQEAIANVPRAWQPGMRDEDFPEKGHGFLEKDLIDEIVKRMIVGTDAEMRAAASALIERKTEKHGPVLWVTLPGADGPMQVYPDQLYRWDGWLCESKNATVPWVQERFRQAKEAARKAEQAYLDSSLMTGVYSTSDGGLIAIPDGWFLDLKTGTLKRAQ